MASAQGPGCRGELLLGVLWCEYNWWGLQSAPMTVHLALKAGAARTPSRPHPVRHPSHLSRSACGHYLAQPACKLPHHQNQASPNLVGADHPAIFSLSAQDPQPPSPSPHPAPLPPYRKRLGLAQSWFKLSK